MSIGEVVVIRIELNRIDLNRVGGGGLIVLRHQPDLTVSPGRPRGGQIIDPGALMITGHQWSTVSWSAGVRVV